jgi:hypothetical protein
VLFRLLVEAEEQEWREAILAYFFLWHFAGADGWPSDRLDEQIERFIARETKIAVDFEVGDALEKLKRLGLVEASADNLLRAVPIEQALQRLDHAWDNLFRYNDSPPATSRPDGNAATDDGVTRRRDAASGTSAPHVSKVATER